MNYVSHPKRYAYALQLVISPKITRKEILLKRYNAEYRIFLSVAYGTVNLNNLVCFVHGMGYVPISQTPHYSYAQNLDRNVKDDQNSYSRYIQKYYPTLNLENSLDKFNKTFLYVKAYPTQTVILLSKKKFFDKDIIIIDGVHRAAIMAALRYSDIQCRISI